MFHEKHFCGQTGARKNKTPLALAGFLALRRVNRKQVNVRSTVKVPA